MALNALAIDIMLPGLQQIGASLGVENENHRQYVITAYLAGFRACPARLSARCPTVSAGAPAALFGLVVYVAAALAAAFAPSFAMLLVLRFVQGIGAAATRVIAVSVMRDVFGGRAMAEVMSLVFMVFMIIPVIAPSLGQLVMLFSEWHMIFVFMAASRWPFTIWAALRLPETLHPEYRRPFTHPCRSPAVSASCSPTACRCCYTLATTIVFGALFGFINSAQQIYVGIYGLGVWFPVLFAAIAGMMAVSSFVNSRLGRPVRHAAAVARGAARLFHRHQRSGSCVSLFGPVAAARLRRRCLPRRCSSSAGSARISTRSRWSRSAMSPARRRPSRASCRRSAAASSGAAIGQSFDGTTTPLAAGFCGVVASSGWSWC